MLVNIQAQFTTLFSTTWEELSTTLTGTATLNGSSVTFDVDDNHNEYFTVTHSDGLTASYMLFSGSVYESVDVTDLTPTDQPLTFTYETLSAKNASIEKYGDDYSTNPGDTVIKLTLTADMANVTDTSVNSISGVEIDLNIDWTQFEAFTYTQGTPQDYESINAIPNTTSSVWQINVDEATGVHKLIVASVDTSANPAKTLVDNVVTDGMDETDQPSSLELGSIYLKPIAGIEFVDFSYEGLIAINEAQGSINQASTSMSIDTTLMDAVIRTDDNMLLDNLTLHYYKDGVDTGVSTLVEDGGIRFDDIVDFDLVKLSVDNAYQGAIDIMDMYGALDNIGSTIDTYAEHAADTNNSDGINIMDMYAVLDGIGQEAQTFDLVDQNGNLVTSLIPDPTVLANWTIVANGDVDMSGAFDQAYVVQADIV
jgi:hypothetical protein